MIDLVSENVLRVSGAITVAEKIHISNPLHIPKQLLERFSQRVAAGRRGAIRQSTATSGRNLCTDRAIRGSPDVSAADPNHFRSNILATASGRIPQRKHLLAKSLDCCL